MAGELSAVFKSLAEDADQAAGNITRSIARMTEKTADIEDANLARTLDTEASNARSFTDLSGEGADARLPGGEGANGGAGGARPPGEPEPAAGGGGQPSEGNGGCDGKGGDPVDAVSGQMITGATDLDLTGLLPLTVRRAYASNFAEGRLFGPGWSSTVDQRLVITDDRIDYVGDDAQVLRYRHPGETGGPVLPGYGARWPMTLDDGTYRIENPETGRTLHFGPNPASPDLRPISAVTDRDGHRVGYRHDPDGLPVAVEHSGGYRVEIETVEGPMGPRVATLFLADPAAPGGRVTVVSYQYDGRGRLVGIVNSSGLPYRYEYDDADRIVSWTDRNNYSYRYVYGADGRVVRGEGLGGFLNARFDHDLANRVTTVTNSLGHATRFHYDEHNHVTSVVDPLGNTETVEFDRYHRLLSYTDPLGSTTRYVRDEAGDPVRIERPDGTRVEVEYDQRWRLPTRVTGPGGAVWRHSYTDTGSLATTTDPLGAVASKTLDDRGHLAASTEPDGQRWAYTSDGAGRPLSVTGPLGATTRYEYDAFGRLRSARDARGAETRFGWTVEGNPAWQAAPGGDVEDLSYDPEGNLLTSRAAAGGTTRFEVGPFNLPIARVARDGTRHTFGYDSELRLVRVTNPAGLTWDYEYDPAGRRISETDFGGRRIGYRYDAAGRVVARTEQSGPTVELVRDVEGRVVRRNVDGEPAAEFEYDTAGRMVRAGDGTTEVSFERDLLGRPLLESINGRAVRSDYDVLGRRVRRVTPSGVESAWSYTPLSAPAGLTGSAGGLAFGYDAAGQEISRRLGAAAMLTQGFDENGRLTGQQLLAGAPNQDPRGFRSVQQRGYRYRPDGLVTAVNDRLAGDRNYRLTTAGRVTAVTAAGWTEEYTYDELGNLTAAQPGAPADTAGPRTLDGFLLRGAGRSSYEYDAQGRLTREVRRTLSGQRRIWTYQWNGRNQLTGASTPDGQRWHYVYDPLGRRVAKQRLDEAGAVADEVTFSWDGTQLVEQQHRVGPRVTATAWDYSGAEPVAQTSRSWLADAPGEIIDARFHAIVADLTGSPSELVDPAGRITWRQTMSLWGNQLAVSSSDGADCPLRYRGQYHDRETGLYYNVHRYYDPQTARYLTPDPLGLPAAPNNYAYVDNPLAYSDPLGLGRLRNGQGQYAKDPNAPTDVHNRSSEYPHEYWDSTHEAMAKKWTVEGVAQDTGTPVDTHGVAIPRDKLTWFDANGQKIPFYKDDYTNLTYDHDPSVVQHWNDEGYDQTAAQREAWYNKTDDMQPMTRAENSSKGAKEKLQYSDKAPGPNYSCS
jgi:RHS repeat-associated protein